MKKITQKKGFTLLELIVVMSIIAILAAAGTTTYSASQRGARDARRQSDLRNIQNAMEQARLSCGEYQPFGAGIIGGDIVACDNGQTILTIPGDPNGTNGYECIGTCNETEYLICTSDQVSTTGERLESRACDDPQAECCVSNRQ